MRKLAKSGLAISQSWSRYYQIWPVYCYYKLIDATQREDNCLYNQRKYLAHPFLLREICISLYIEIQLVDLVHGAWCNNVIKHHSLQSDQPSSPLTNEKPPPDLPAGISNNRACQCLIGIFRANEPQYSLPASYMFIQFYNNGNGGQVEVKCNKEPNAQVVGSYIRHYTVKFSQLRMSDN